MAKAHSKREKIINKVSNMKRPVLLRLAAASGLPVSSLQKLRSGQTSTITDEMFEKIGDALGY